MGQIVFVTGTDTGVGKTVLTALLLTHARRAGWRAWGMKPFCSGGRGDARVIAQAMAGELSLDQVNPFYFPEPVAPLVSARCHSRSIPFRAVTDAIRRLAARCDLLLVEGAGGLLVPLGEHYTAADLIRDLRSPVLLAVRNKLGAINHTLLNCRILQQMRVPDLKIVLCDTRQSSLATESNNTIIKEWAAPTQVFRLPFLGAHAASQAALQHHEKILKKTLAKLLPRRIVSTAFGDGAKKKAETSSRRRQRKQ